MKKMLGIIMMVLLLVSLFNQNQTVYANEGADYSVSPIFSEHQTKTVDSFFDIRWEPKQKDIIGLKITNNEATEQSYSIELNKARTNINGIIDYSNNEPEAETAKYKITEIVKLPQKIKVPANSTKSIEGSVFFGSKDFNGIIMGGLHISKIDSSKNSASVANTVSYNIPIVLRGNVDKRPNPEINLETIKVAKFSSDKYALNILLNNKNVNFLKEVKFKATVTNSADDVIESQTNQIDITPETKFIYPIKLEGKYKPGEYQVKLQVNHSKKNRWTFDDKFTISKKDVKDIKAVTQNDNGNWLVYIILGMIVVAGIGLIIFLRKRHK